MRCITRGSHSLPGSVAPPQPPPHVQHWIARTACGLRPRLQRRLLGKPPRLDGQELAPDIQMLLWLAALEGEFSLVEGRSVEQARAENRAGVPVVNGPARPMARVEAVSIPGPAGARIGARLYVALDSPKPPQPLLVYYHGGGWVIGDLDTHDGVCRFLAEHGDCRVLSIDYRLAPEHHFPAPVEDAVAAFEWAADHAGDLGADPERIAVGGDSAGGNLSAAVCLQARDGGGPRPAMQLLLYPPTDATGGQESREIFAKGFLLTRDDMEWFEAHYLPDGCDHEDPRVSMMRAKDVSGLPPAYVATAGFDPLRDEGETYALRMREAGVKVALQRHPGLIHGFANLTAICPNARAAMLEAAGALRMALA